MQRKAQVHQLVRVTGVFLFLRLDVALELGGRHITPTPQRCQHVGVAGAGRAAAEKGIADEGKDSVEPLPGLGQSRDLRLAAVEGHEVEKSIAGHQGGDVAGPPILDQNRFERHFFLMEHIEGSFRERQGQELSLGLAILDERIGQAFVEGRGDRVCSVDIDVVETDSRGAAGGFAAFGVAGQQQDQALLILVEPLGILPIARGWARRPDGAFGRRPSAPGRPG